MNASIKTITLKNVEVQENGIIRNEKGRLIARLVDGVDFSSEHIKGVAEDIDFIRELSQLINKRSLENKNNTPDFILATYLSRCLDNFSSIPSCHKEVIRERRVIKVRIYE